MELRNIPKVTKCLIQLSKLVMQLFDLIITIRFLSHGNFFSGRIGQGQSPQLHGLRLLRPDEEPRLGSERKSTPSLLFVQFSKNLIGKART